MPLYEFDCDACGQPFETLVRRISAIDEVTCPQCGAARVTRKLSLVASRVQGATPSPISAGNTDCAPGGT